MENNDSQDRIIDEKKLEEKGEYEVIADSFVVNTVRKILIESIEKRASDIFIEPLEDNLRVRYRIDGLLCNVGQYPLDYASGIISRLKVLSGLDIAEHRFPQDGRFKMSFGGRIIDFRVSTMPSNLGEKVVLRVLDKSRISLNIDNLGFDREAIEILKRNLKKPYGMILVCGPTGCGKTTTLYACLKFVDSIEKNIISVEDPIEYQLYGINQVAVQEQLGLTFAQALRAILRQDPDIIMVGEIRDFETADIAVKASLTGHLVLSTLHTTTATAAVVRFINMGIEPFLVASSCLVTASQALLRILCSSCKERIDISEGFKRELEDYGLELPQNFSLYKSKGCRLCNNTGYLGRTGIIEVLELDSEIRELLIKKESERTIRERAKKKGMKSLREKALLKIIEGLTSIEEVYRVTSKE